MNWKYIKGKFTKQSLLNNIGLKVASLAVAIVLWLVVVNITDPVVSQPYRNVRVNIINSSVITDNGKTLEILDDSDLISTVNLKASRTTIQQLGISSDVIVATADMSKLSADGKTVPIELSTSKYSDKIDSIRSSSNTLYVNIENKKTIQLPIVATTSGEIESGYIIGNVTPQQNQVRVSGPESKIEKVKAAGVDVQITGFTEDISTMADIVLFDDLGEPLPKDGLSMNIETVRLDAEILATKRVPIYYSTIGTPAEGYDVTGEIVCNPETVVIAGSTSAINSVSSINVPGSELNVTGQTGNLTDIVELSQFLPDGIRFGDSKYNGNVTFTVYIEPLVTDSYSVNAGTIEIANVPLGFEAKIEDENESIEYTLRGLAQNLEKMELANVKCRVDLSDYQMVNDIAEFTSGTYACDLVMDLPNDVELANPVKVSVVLTEIKND